MEIESGVDAGNRSKVRGCFEPHFYERCQPQTLYRFKLTLYQTLQACCGPSNQQFKVSSQIGPVFKQMLSRKQFIVKLPGLGSIGRSFL